MPAKGKVADEIETLVMKVYGSHGAGERVLCSRRMQVRTKSSPEGSEWLVVGKQKPLIYRAKWWTARIRVAVSAPRKLAALGVKEIPLPTDHFGTLWPSDRATIDIPVRLITTKLSSRI